MCIYIYIVCSKKHISRRINKLDIHIPASMHRTCPMCNTQEVIASMGCCQHARAILYSNSSIHSKIYSNDAGANLWQFVCLNTSSVTIAHMWTGVIDVFNVFITWQKQISTQNIFKVFCTSETVPLWENIP